MFDAYFAGLTARQAPRRLAAPPDGVLIPEETVQAFRPQLGGPLKLRLQSAADDKYHVISMRHVSIARDFPYTPKDSFLVANASDVAGVTGTHAQGIVLMRTRGDSDAVATVARRVLVSRPGIQVTTLDETHRLIGSSFTSVDLRSLTALELGFAVPMATEVTGLRSIDCE